MTTTRPRADLGRFSSAGFGALQLLDPLAPRPLAADRAGSRFGEACTRSPAWAGALQSRLAGIGKSDRFFPAIGDLPEFMAQAEFQRRFGGVGQPAYQRMEAEIERRIAGLAIYREPSRD